MIKLDISTYMDKFISPLEYENEYSKKADVIKKFNSYEMIGWTREVDDNLLDEIIRVSNKVRANSSCLVVIGIGGSFLGSLAVNEMFRPYFNDNNFKIIYAGTTLSSKYMSELLEYLKGVDYSVNVISKSGTTMETTITYDLIKEEMKKKYSKEELKERIIVTTDKEKGSLRAEVNEEGYDSFIIPDDIGGRYSFITPAHLLPLALNYDIKKIVRGYEKGKLLEDEAFKYAVIRNLLFKKGKYVENFCVYEQSLSYFTEWLKQLFGESEGKEGKGILPMSTVQTRDLHSLGQFIQEGNKIIFETFIKINESVEVITNGRNLHEVNNLVLDSVIRAHYSGDVPCVVLELDELSLERIGQVLYFFMMSAAFSGILMEIDPFNQPGVEVYKKEIRESLKKDEEVII